jgi:hypothetical protein
MMRDEKLNSNSNLQRMRFKQGLQISSIGEDSYLVQALQIISIGDSMIDHADGA